MKKSKLNQAFEEVGLIINNMGLSLSLKMMIVRLTIKVSNWGFFILALKSCFDDEKKKFRTFMMIVQVQFCKKHSRKQ